MKPTFHSRLQRLHPRALGTHAIVGRSKLRPVLSRDRPRLARRFRRGDRETVHYLLVHSRIRPLQGRQRGESLRRRSSVGLRRAAPRAQRQMRAPAVRARKYGGSEVPRSRIPADLLRRGEFRGRQREIPSLGEYGSILETSTRGAVRTGAANPFAPIINTLAAILLVAQLKRELEAEDLKSILQTKRRAKEIQL